MNEKEMADKIAELETRVKLLELSMGFPPYVYPQYAPYAPYSPWQQFNPYVVYITPFFRTMNYSE